MDLAPPDEVAAAWAAAMRRGDFEEAWRQTDRIELPRRAAQGDGRLARASHHLRWDGSALKGRSVLVRCEHGLGDTLQFIRFIPRLVAMAREAHLLVQPPLLGLLQGAPGLGQVLDGWTDQPAPPHDVELEVMELAYALRARITDLPPPYPGLRRHAEGRLPFDLPGDGALRVGLLWAASDWDTSRSIPLTLLRPLLRGSDASFFSLQQGAAGNDPLVSELGIYPLSRHTADIAAAACAMLALDLIISVDAMAAHLAGTLGQPIWLLLKHEADWRWMECRSDSPWYPAMRLFRQPAPGDWPAVIETVAQALRRYR